MRSAQSITHEVMHRQHCLSVGLAALVEHYSHVCKIEVMVSIRKTCLWLYIQPLLVTRFGNVDFQNTLAPWWMKGTAGSPLMC